MTNLTLARSVIGTGQITVYWMVAQNTKRMYGKKYGILSVETFCLHRQQHRQINLKFNLKGGLFAFTGAQRVPSYKTMHYKYHDQNRANMLVTLTYAVANLTFYFQTIT